MANHGRSPRGSLQFGEGGGGGGERSKTGNLASSQSTTKPA